MMKPKTSRPGFSLFRASEIDDVVPGQTIPDNFGNMFRRHVEQNTQADNLEHLPQFERLKSQIDQVKKEITEAAIAAHEFEKEIETHRETLAQKRDELAIKLATLEDHAREHIKSVFPNYTLVEDPATPPTMPDTVLPTKTPMEDIK